MTATERIAELEAQVAWLRAELALDVDVDAVQRIELGLKVTFGQAVILWALYRRRGRPLTNAQMAELDLGPRGKEERTSSYLRVVVSRIRRRLGWDVVLTVRRRDCHGAYRLGNLGRELLEPIVGPAEVPGLPA